MKNSIKCPNCESHDISTIDISYMKEIKQCDKCKTEFEVKYKMIPVSIKKIEGMV